MGSYPPVRRAQVSPAESVAAMLERYGMNRPSAEEARAGLARVVGAERARDLWSQACEIAGLDADGPQSLGQLKRVAACMATLPGPAGVMGASLSLRIGAYEAITGASSSGRDRGGAMSEKDPSSPDPVVREERLQEIADLGLTRPEVDAELRDIAARAAESLGLPIGIVSIVLDRAQYFAAGHGLQGWLAEVRGTPVEWSFCVNAVRSREPFVVEDALENPLVSDSPLVRQEGLRCYAGIPLITSRGHVLGTLCVAGTEQRSFGPEDLDKLRGLARDAVARIETRRR